MSFIRNYTDYCTGNEAPPIFHVWSGLATLSSIISRRVWVKRGMFVFYPNLYVMLVGPPGDGKTTAMSVGKRMIREIKGIPLSATAATPQAIMQLMEKRENNDKPLQQSFKRLDGKIEEYTPLAIFATEFSQFIGMNAPGWIDFLTTIYDEDAYEVQTKNKGDNIIPGPNITLLGCMTDDTTSSYLKQNIISGGFSRRCIFVYSTGRGEPQPEPQETPEMLRAWRACVEWAQKLKTVSGIFTLTSEANEFYNDWYRKLRVSLDKESDPVTIGYYKSKHVQLLKTAMLMSLSESTELILQKNILELALAFLGQAEANLGKVFAGTGRNELASVKAKIMNVLDKTKEPISLKKLKGMFFSECGGQEFDQIIFHLEETNQVRKITVTKGNVSGIAIGTPGVISRFQTRTGSATDIVIQLDA